MKTRKAFMFIIVMFAMLVCVVPANAEDKPKPDAKGKVTASDSATVKVEGKEKAEKPDKVDTPDADKKEKSDEKELKITKTLKPVKILEFDKVNFELMKKAIKYDMKLELKVRKYIAKLDRNVYVQIDIIRKHMLEDGWNLQSVTIPNKKEAEDTPEQPLSKKNMSEMPPKLEYIKDKYVKKDLEQKLKDSDHKTDLVQINDIEYIDVGIDVDKEQEPEKVKNVDFVYVETGMRMSTSTSVAVNRKMVELKNLIKEYHDALFEYLKFKYSSILDGIDIEEKTLPEEIKKKEDNGSLTTKVAKIKTTTYCDKFNSAWKIDWDKKKLEFNLEEAFIDVLEEAKNRGESKLIHESDLKFVLSLEKIIGIYGELEDKALKATFRAGWSEFDLGWVMFIFGVLTLYGGLAFTILIDFRSRRKAKK